MNHTITNEEKANILNLANSKDSANVELAFTFCHTHEWMEGVKLCLSLCNLTYKLKAYLAYLFYTIDASLVEEIISDKISTYIVNPQEFEYLHEIGYMQILKSFLGDRVQLSFNNVTDIFYIEEKYGYALKGFQGNAKYVLLELPENIQKAFELKLYSLFVYFKVEELKPYISSGQCVDYVAYIMQSIKRTSLHFQLDFGGTNIQFIADMLSAKNDNLDFLTKYGFCQLAEPWAGVAEYNISYFFIYEDEIFHTTDKSNNSFSLSHVDQWTPILKKSTYNNCKIKCKNYASIETEFTIKNADAIKKYL